MAILRELVTLVSFEVEGVNKVDAAIGQVKTSLLSLGKLFGIAFGIEKLYEWGDELVSAAKEVAKLQYQLTTTCHYTLLVKRVKSLLAVMTHIYQTIIA